MNMKKSLIAAAMASVCAAPLAAQAQTNVYGEFIAGFENLNDEAVVGSGNGDGDTTLTLDTALIGIEFSQDLGNDITFDAATEVEMIAPTQEGDSVEFDNTAGAFSGDFGRVQIGWGVDSVYYLHVFEAIDRGIIYDTYTFEPLGDALGPDSPEGRTSQIFIDDEAEFSVQYSNSSGPLSFTAGAVMDDGTTVTGSSQDETETFDRIGIGATYDAGVVSVGAAHESTSNPVGGGEEPSTTGVSVAGTAGAVDLAAQFSSHDLDNAAGNEPTVFDVIASTDFGGGLGGTLGFSSVDADRANSLGDETRIHAQLTRSVSPNIVLFGQLLSGSIDGGTGDDVDPTALFVGVESGF